MVFGLHSLIAARLSYVVLIVFEMEVSQPETVAEMLAFSMVAYPIGADDRVTSAGSERLSCDPDPPAHGGAGKHF